MQRVRLSAREDAQGSVEMEACQPQPQAVHQAEAPESENCENGQMEEVNMFILKVLF